MTTPHELDAEAIDVALDAADLGMEEIADHAEIRRFPVISHALLNEERKGERSMKIWEGGG